LHALACLLPVYPRGELMSAGFQAGHAVDVWCVSSGRTDGGGRMVSDSSLVVPRRSPLRRLSPSFIVFLLHTAHLRGITYFHASLSSLALTCTVLSFESDVVNRNGVIEMASAGGVAASVA